MYENLGTHWATSLLAFLTLAMLPFPYALTLLLTSFIPNIAIDFCSTAAGKHFGVRADLPNET